MIVGLQFSLTQIIFWKLSCHHYRKITEQCEKQWLLLCSSEIGSQWKNYNQYFGKAGNIVTSGLYQFTLNRSLWSLKLRDTYSHFNKPTETDCELAWERETPWGHIVQVFVDVNLQESYQFLVLMIQWKCPHVLGRGKGKIKYSLEYLPCQTTTAGETMLLESFNRGSSNYIASATSPIPLSLFPILCKNKGKKTERYLRKSQSGDPGTYQKTEVIRRL